MESLINMGEGPVGGRKPEATGRQTRCGKTGQPGNRAGAQQGASRPTTCTRAIDERRKRVKNKTEIERLTEQLGEIPRLE